MTLKEEVKYHRTWLRIYLMMCAISGGAAFKGICLLATSDDASEDLKIRSALISFLFIDAAISFVWTYKKLKSAQEKLNKMNNDYER